MGVHGFANQPKLTREYLKSRNRYVATTAVSESVIESGDPSFSITSVKVVFPGTMNATSSWVKVVLSVMRTTLQPTDDKASDAAMKKAEANLHTFGISIIKRAKI